MTNFTKFVLKHEHEIDKMELTKLETDCGYETLSSTCNFFMKSFLSNKALLCWLEGVGKKRREKFIFMLTYKFHELQVDTSNFTKTKNSNTRFMRNGKVKLLLKGNPESLIIGYKSFVKKKLQLWPRIWEGTVHETRREWSEWNPIADSHLFREELVMNQSIFVLSRSD